MNTCGKVTLVGTQVERAGEPAEGLCDRVSQRCRHGASGIHRSGTRCEAGRQQVRSRRSLALE